MLLQFFRLFLTMIANVAKVDVLVKFATSYHRHFIWPNLTLDLDKMS